MAEPFLEHYVLLAPSHPDYQVGLNQVIGYGITLRSEMESLFPLPNYEVVQRKPSGTIVKYREKTSQEKLTQAFLEEINSISDADLTDEQLSELSQVSASVQQAHDLAPFISRDKYKKMLSGAVSNAKNLPPSFDTAKTQLLNVIDANF